MKGKENILNVVKSLIFFFFFFFFLIWTAHEPKKKKAEKRIEDRVNQVAVYGRKCTEYRVKRI